MPVIGEIKKDYEIGRGYKHDNLIWLACSGCGVERWVRVTDTRKQNYTGMCKPCMIQSRDWKLDKSPNWKGGIKHCGKRILIYIPLDNPYRPMADELGYVFEHRLVMAKHLGRCLTTEEVVHHEDEIQSHNDVTNLKLFPDDASHASYHRRKEIELWGRRPTNALGQYMKGGYNYAH